MKCDIETVFFVLHFGQTYVVINMDLPVYILLLVISSQLRIFHSVRVFGIITENVTFFYQRFPVAPSKSYTIEFNVSYHKGSMGYTYPIMGIYTKYSRINVYKRCSYIQYEQLHNENLHPYLRVGRYRTTTCSMSGPDTVNCTGRVTVQDYIPRNFSFSFGFHCDSPRTNSLQGLKYNISLWDPNIGTINCIDYSTIPYSGACSRFYKQAFLPNLIGEETIDRYAEYFKQSTFFEALALWDGTCYQHVWEVVCYIFLPKCDPIGQQVIHPCQETCLDLLEGCLKKIEDLLKGIDSEFRYNSDFYATHLPSLNMSREINCDYLPSINNSIHCFYKSVTCDSPPFVQNGIMTVNDTQKNGYQLHDMVSYTCINGTYKMKGNSFIRCLHSGQWSHPPPQCVHQILHPVHPLHVVFPALVLPLIIYISLTFYSWCHKVELHTLMRNKKYDAFVCYCYEVKDSDFAEKVVPFQLEEKHGFKLCIHRRDFKAGWDIKWNIMNAIRNSNSAIIIMSQDYINSLWCVEEFEDCYMENMKDSAFKLFVILMQAADTLNTTNEYMRSFFSKKTYLEREDPKLFKKIAEYLIWVKQPKREKQQLELASDDAMNVLLNKRNEYDEDSRILLEEQREHIDMLKLNSQIEANSDHLVLNNNDDNSDNEADRRLLTENRMENNSEFQGDFEHLTKAEVHHGT